MLGVMRSLAAVPVIFLLSAQIGDAQSERDFSGVWRLNPTQSEIRELPAAPAYLLRVEQNSGAMTLFARAHEGAALVTSAYPLNGQAEKSQIGDSTTSTVTKWEGAALLVNTIVSGPENYSIMERWQRSGNGNKLTITRTVVRPSGESESVLVYENPNAVVKEFAKRPPQHAVQPAPPPTPQGTALQDTTPRETAARETALPEAAVPAGAPVAQPPEYVIGAGTRILLRLTNAVNTKRTTAGDRVYLQTAAPVFIKGRIVVPVGSYVNGTVIESERAGHIKGKSELNLRFDSLTLPNGTTRDFRARAGSVDTNGNLDRSEGKIKGDSNKGADTRTVAKTTTAGTGIGAIAGAATGHLGMGAGIGAAGGAVAGLAGVIAKRGPDVVLPQGTTMELVLDRELNFNSADLNGLQ